MFGGSFPATGVLLEIGHLSFRLCYSGSDHSLLGEDAPKPRIYSDRRDSPVSAHSVFSHISHPTSTTL